MHMFKGAVSKDVVSRAWHKMQVDWEAWCQFIEGLDARVLRRPALLIIDGAPGREAALTALWGEDLPIQRCMVHKHRNFPAHAPKNMHGELCADDRDMIYARNAVEVEAQCKAFLRKWRLKWAPSLTVLKKR